MCVQSQATSVSAVCVPWHFCCLNSCHVVIHSSFCFHQALVVHFEADTERRKLGLPHRVNFLGRSSLEPEYTQTEEVQLHLQRTPVCTTVVFQLHVSYKYVYLERWKDDYNFVWLILLSTVYFSVKTLSFLHHVKSFWPKSLHFFPCSCRRAFGTNCAPSHWR